MADLEQKKGVDAALDVNAIEAKDVDFSNTNAVIDASTDLNSPEVDPAKNSEKFLENFNAVKGVLHYHDGGALVTISRKNLGDLNRGGNGYREITFTRKWTERQERNRDFPRWGRINPIAGFLYSLGHDIENIQRSKTISLRRYTNGKYRLNGIELKEAEVSHILDNLTKQIKKCQNHAENNRRRGIDNALRRFE